MDGQQWVKELRHRVNEAYGDYYDVIELDFDEVDEIIEIIEKHINRSANTLNMTEQDVLGMA